MRRHCLIVAMVLSVNAILAAEPAAETIDRVVAVVNSHTILLSEWDTAARLEALLDHRPLDSITDATRHATFDRMIDQELLRGEMENSSVKRSSPEDVTAKLLDVRRQYSAVATDVQWHELLARYGVTEPELEAAIASELDGLRLLDFRLRSSAQPEAAQIERYYHSVYEPAMLAKRARPAPLADVTPQIREILTQQKLTDLTSSWMQTLRAQAIIQINVRFPDTPAPNTSQLEPFSQTVLGRSRLQPMGPTRIARNR